MSDPILSLPVAGINIYHHGGANNELMFGIGLTCVFAAPARCRVSPSRITGSSLERLIIASADSTLAVLLDIADPAEQQQLKGLLARLQEKIPCRPHPAG